MKKFIFLYLFSGCVYAQVNQTSIDICDIKAIKQNTYDIRACRSANLGPNQGLMCIQDSYKKLTANVCSPELAISYNNISELYKSLIHLSDPVNSRKYSTKQYSDKWDAIADLIEKESNDAVQFTKNEYARREIDYYRNQANRNIESSMMILGATLQQPRTTANTNSSPFRTYILNGRMINCMTTDNLVTCN